MKNGNEEDVRIEREALIHEIETRLKELTVEQLRRVDWYINRIDK